MYPKQFKSIVIGHGFSEDLLICSFLKIYFYFMVVWAFSYMYVCASPACSTGWDQKRELPLLVHHHTGSRNPT